MDLKKKLQELNALLGASIGNKIRYRTENNIQFINDILKDVKIANGNVIITMNNDVVITKEVYDVSFTRQEDRSDVWIYGKEVTNRFNVFDK